MYNANPTSVAAALQTVANLGLGQKIAVLGEMAEVDDPERAHKYVARLAEELGIDVVAIDTDLYGVAAHHDVPDFVRKGLMNGNAAVVVKGSRVAGLERIVEALKLS